MKSSEKDEVGSSSSDDRCGQHHDAPYPGGNQPVVPCPGSFSSGFLKAACPQRRTFRPPHGSAGTAHPPAGRIGLCGCGYSEWSHRDRLSVLLRVYAVCRHWHKRKNSGEGPDRLLGTSCAMGPALEGMNITCGCRAVPGAVNAVMLGDDMLPRFTTIGGLPPIGICGSGLVDLVAALVASGVIATDGAFNPEAGQEPFQ